MSWSHGTNPTLALKLSLHQVGTGADKSQRATSLEPQAWQAMLANAQRVRTDGCAEASEQPAPVLLDVRNSYEWDAGHFEGASKPQEEEFRETPCSADDLDAVPAPLRGLPADTPVMVRLSLLLSDRVAARMLLVMLA